MIRKEDYDFYSYVPVARAAYIVDIFNLRLLHIRYSERPCIYQPYSIRVMIFFRSISDLRLILLPAVSPMRLPLNQAGRNGFSDFWRFSLNQGEQTLGEALTQFFEPMVDRRQ
jgi:hypothetical protein